ncbi:radical SAM protein [Chloroflexota bacterium]
MRVIYRPRGRAGEYAEWAANLYTGCAHRCIYCYGADVTHTDKEKFETEPLPRHKVLERLQADARDLQREERSIDVLLCFVTDPYQPLEDVMGVTRQAIQILHRYGHTVTILTKGGKRAMRDIADGTLGPGDTFASTLTLLNDQDSQHWEPGAALPLDRIESLKIAKEHGLATWVSLEPVIKPNDSLDIIRATHKFVDLFKVGKMNYHPQGLTINWHKFANDVVRLCRELKHPYFLKIDLEKYLRGGRGITR